VRRPQLDGTRVNYRRLVEENVQLSIVRPETVKELPPTEIVRAGELTILRFEKEPELLILRKIRLPRSPLERCLLGAYLIIGAGLVTPPLPPSPSYASQLNVTRLVSAATHPVLVAITLQSSSVTYHIN
jgi:hypothetical protein